MTPEELQALLDSLGQAESTEAAAEILSELSAEDLAAVESELSDTIRTLATSVRDGEAENPAEAMEAVRAAQESLTVVESRIDEVTEASQAVADEASAALEALGEEAEETPEEEPEAPAGETEETPEAGEEAEPVAEPEAEPVAASAQPRRPVRLGEVAAHRRRQPEPQPESPITLVAAGAFDDAHVRSGQRYSDPTELGRAMGAAQRNLPKGPGKTVVAQANFADRMRYTMPEQGGFAAWPMVERIRREAERATQNPDGSLSYEGETITASGGFCAPGTPIYDFFSVTTREGLLQLPSVTSERGAIEWPISPGFPQLFGATGIATEWTNTTDTTPGETTKGVFTPDCVTTQSCEIIAWATRLGFGTFQSMFYPEFVAHLTEESLMVHDHTVDIELLEDIEGFATLVQDLTGEVGAGTLVNLTNVLGYIGSWYRRKWRMSTSATLDLLLPAWVRDAGAADYIARNATVDLGRARAAVDAAINDMGYRVQWLANLGDELTPNTYWPQAEALIFAPGTIVRQTRATLDLGVVRDTTTIDTNDFQTFVETFDSACLVGNEVVHLTGLDVCPTGGTGELVSIACPTGESS